MLKLPKISLGRSYSPLIGLDITTSSIKLIELSQSGGQYRVEAYAAEPTPHNSINEKAIVDAFGSVDKAKEEFVQAGVTQFGSGWAWLAVKDGKVIVAKTPNGESPLVHGASPILGVDVWEHSYYIDYRNRRPDYLKAFVDNLVNWEYVAELYSKAK